MSQPLCHFLVSCLLSPFTKELRGLIVYPYVILILYLYDFLIAYPYAILIVYTYAFLIVYPYAILIVYIFVILIVYMQ